MKLDMNADKILICPCGKWHRVAVSATEKHVQRYECGLKAEADSVTWLDRPSGFAEFTMKGREVTIDGLASDGNRLYIFLSQIG